MTRKVCKDYQSSLFDHHNSTDWETWQLAETLRRTVHLVNIINRLSHSAKSAASNFYEPLDDDLILDLALPAPDMLWKAKTAEEFQKAKTAGQNSALQTPRMLLRRAEGVVLESGWADNSGGDGSREFSRLVMAVWQ